ncbi:lysoplasmalogenase [Bacillus massiliigorillae]|uniref:lysoplasmalogenase n=1 Tax=Bacillus massiliigorillae TaxID=1243664 RepID=UPI0003AACB88|nr:lysoplasmalogenase [Bacillus massiliigorillae]
MKRFILPLAIILSGLLFIFVIPKDNEFIRLIFKLIPMVLILIYAYKRQNTYYTIIHERLILAGLFVCMLGDAFIIFSFLLGLVAFLIGHLFYIGAFLKQWKFSKLRALAALPIIIYGIFFGNKITTALSLDGNTALIIPVIIYVIVLSIMGWTAFMTGNKWAIIGSILFIASDTILSWNLFVSDVTYSTALIMLTYYSAQLLIAKSLIYRKPALYVYPSRPY